MFSNYFKIAFRNFVRHKSYTFINISGLAIGIACCLVIVLFVRNELNYDKFHRYGDRIYRVLRLANDEGQLRKTAVTSGPFAEALLTDYPADVEAAIRVMPNDGLVEYQDKVFREEKFYLADAGFFEFFSYPLLVGTPQQVLTQPNSVVISQEIASKYFGDADPIGKILTLDQQYEFKVTGIFGIFPGNTHLDFDFVASMDIIKSRSWFGRWWWNSFFTYVRLPAGGKPQQLEATFPGFMDKYFGDHFRETGWRIDLVLEPLKDIYFDYATTFDLIQHGDRNIVYIFSAIAFLILMIACINFMNLATARSSGRAMEVGLRKVMGAYRQNLIVQFVGEAIILSLLAMVLAVVLAEFFLPYCNHLFQLSLSLDYTDLRLPLMLIAAGVVVGLISGSYPALFLSALQPVKVLKSKTGEGGWHAKLRQGLVVAQFGVSIVLVIGTIVMFYQLSFVGSKKLGFDKEQTALVRVSNSEFYRNRLTFKNELLRHHQVISVSAMSGEPGGFHDNFSFDVEGISGARRLRTVYTDFDYCKTLGLQIVHGRDFSREYGTDSSGVILNETAVKSLGWNNQEALGKTMTINLLDSTRRHVIGVVKDYHFTSLKNEIEPLAISIYSDHRVLAVRLKPGMAREALKIMKEAWSKAAAGYPFEYNFLDESFDRLYHAEKNQREIFTIFAMLAIFIACLGLFGLAAFSAEQRIREIGIRKVLGATVTQVIVQLSKNFVQMVLLANLVAWPIAWYLMNKWLQNFAYRIDISWWMFALAGGLAMVIALVTVSTQAVRTALANPVEALRYE